MLALPNEVDFAKLLLLKCAEQTCMFKDAVNSFPPNSNNSCFPSHWVWRKTVKWQERSIARAIWTQRHRTVIAIFTKFKTLGRRSTVDVTGDLEKHWPTKTHLPPKAKQLENAPCTNLQPYGRPAIRLDFFAILPGNQMMWNSHISCDKCRLWVGAKSD